MFPFSLPAGKVCRGLLIACLLSLTTLSASAVSQTSGGKHCLWRITNAKASVYLLGSIHILRANDYPLPTVIDQAVQQAQQFYFEIDPNKFDEYHRDVDAASRLPHGVEIKDRVHPKTWNYLRTTARGGNFDWIHYKAWAIAQNVLAYPMHELFSLDLGVDNYVVKKAKARGRPMRGLESAAEHAAIFAGMNDVESESYLLRAIVYAGQTEGQIRDGIAAWKVGNTGKLAALQEPPVREAPGLNARFLQWRNDRWLPVIENVAKSNTPTLIVAGAAHFSGAHSVLSLLRERGYQIEQL